MKVSKFKKALLLPALLAAMIIAAGCGMTHEESLAQKDAWAEDIVRKSLIGLANGHAINEPAPDAELLDDAFNYTYIGGLEFLDPRAEYNLCSNDYYLPKRSKVIIASPSYSSDQPMQVLYYDKERYMEESGITDEKAADKPLFTPMFYKNAGEEELRTHLTGATIAESVDDSVFADGLDKCDYLIVFDTLRSKVEPNYYKNGMDRVTITTVVMVINVKDIAVEHIQVIKIDVPPVTYSLGAHMGHFDLEGTVNYITALLTEFK